MFKQGYERKGHSHNNAVLCPKQNRRKAKQELKKNKEEM
jgi:hypothetical protein